MKNLLIITLLVIIQIMTFAQKNDRPNIVWFTCEDISPTLSMYGDNTAKTPNLDKLAKEGVVFDNVYAVVGVCAPSRSSIITGMYPTSIGTMHMRTGKDIQSWGNHNYSGESNAFDINGDAIPLYSAVIPSFVKCFTEYMRKAGYYCINNQKTDYQFAAPVTAWDENGGKGDWSHTPKGKPFFYVFNHGVTHESQIWKRKDEPMTVDPDKVPLPSYYPEDPVVRKDVARNYSNIEVLDQQIGEKIQRLKDAGVYENTIVFFFSDHGGPLPRGKRLHYDSGLRVPFIVRIPEKYKAKYGIDNSRINNGHVEELISFVDLAPTMMSIAGVKAPEYMQGQVFMGTQQAAPERKYIFGTGDRFDEHTDRNRIVRDDRYLYVRNYHTELPAYKDISYRRNIDMMNRLLELHKLGRLNAAQNYWFRLYKTKEEFYDCETDPDNVHNLIDNPEYKDKIKELSGALDNWLAEVGDMASIPEKEMFLQMWPEGIQPVTEMPHITTKGRNITLSCNTEGASIAYLISDKDFNPGFNNGWQLYSAPVKVPKGKFVYVMAQRIGYKESEIVKENF